MKPDLAESKKTRKLKELILAEDLEEIGIIRLILNSVILTFAVLIGIIIWAAIVEIEELSIAPGTIVPPGKIRTVQHLEGGVVSSIHVKDGEMVDKDQLMVSLTPVAAVLTLQETQSKKIAFEIDRVRLNAFINQNITLDIDDIIREVDAITNDNYQNYLTLINSALKLLREQNQTRENERLGLQQNIESLGDEVIFLEQKLKNLKIQRKLLTESQEIYSELRESKAVSQISFLQAKEKQTLVERELLETLSKQNEVKSTLKSTQNKIAVLDANYKEQALEELNDVQAELLQIKSTVSKLQDRVKRLDIRAPVQGIIKGFSLGVGSVIEPGGVIAEIVPLDQDLIMEANINPSDIGQININNKVHVKVSAYSFTKYGSIYGKIKNISASTFTDSQGTTFYKAIIELDKQFFGDDPNENLIMPGMIATADIVTGKKTILAYLLKPLRNALQMAFKEK